MTHFVLLSGQSAVIVSPSSCLESYTNYSIRIVFNRYKNDVTTPDATLLVDSVSCYLALKLIKPHTLINTIQTSHLNQTSHLDQH